jgi:hypothetical protein
MLVLRSLSPLIVVVVLVTILFFVFHEERRPEPQARPTVEQPVLGANVYAKKN